MFSVYVVHCAGMYLVLYIGCAVYDSIYIYNKFVYYSPNIFVTKYKISKVLLIFCRVLHQLSIY
jgi:hypothetical protein